MNDPLANVSSANLLNRDLVLAIKRYQAALMLCNDRQFEMAETIEIFRMEFAEVP